MHIPRGSLDVLAQQAAAEVSHRQCGILELFGMFRRSYPYSTISVEAFEKVIGMLAGEFRFSMPYPPWPLVMWDRNAGLLSPVRGATHVTSMNVGTIEDPSEYEVVIEKSKKHIGKIESDFVDDTLRPGEIFALGNSSWRVRGKRKNRVMVEEAPGATPTVPWWTGGVVKRTEEVGRKVGMLRREIARRSDDRSCIAWLQSEYRLCADGAEALREYVRSQQLACAIVPDHEHLLAENWRDELGRSNVIIHCPLGERINRTWGLALTEAARDIRDEEWSLTASNDLILLTLKHEREGSPRNTGADDLLSLVHDKNLDFYLLRGIQITGGSRFRGVATCALQILRAKEGKRVPVWLQNHRAQELFDAAIDNPDYPLFKELRQLTIEETLDFEGCKQLLLNIREKHSAVSVRDSESPSPFCHTLLVKSHYAEGGHQMGRERRAHLLRLHRKILEDVLTTEELAEILDDRAIEKMEAKQLHRSEETRARNADELAQAIHDIGEIPADVQLIKAMNESNELDPLHELVNDARIVAVRVPDCEENPVRLVTADSWRLYFDAYAAKDAKPTALRPRLKDESFSDFEETSPEDVISQRWLEPYERSIARKEVLSRYLRSRGPISLYEIINHTGWTPNLTKDLLSALEADGSVASGVYTSSKPKPQWVDRTNLEHIHRLTMGYLRRELAACAPYEVVDFVSRWQHLHPDTRLKGIDGVRKVVKQIQGLEPLQGYIEPDILAGRVSNYSPEMLDKLIASGEVR